MALSQNRVLTTLAAGLVIAAASHALPVVGTSSGIFQNPVGEASAQLTGVGTNNFTWGNGAPFGSPSSSLNFGGTGFATNTGDVFSFGTLTYYNGTIAAGTGATGVDFLVTLSLTTPVKTENFDFAFNLINTPNVGTPNEQADFVQLGSTLSTSSFSYAGIDYTLELLGFGNISGSGFSAVNEFHVLENASASAQMFGRITASTPTPEAVPEPATLALFGLGLVGLGAAARRRRA